MNFRRTKAVAVKEFRHILRDTRSLIMALAIPVLLLLLFGFALSLDVDNIPTTIYDTDRTAESRALIERFRASRFFDVRSPADSYDEIQRMIDRGQILLAVVIPRDFSDQLLANHQAEVQLLLDGSDSNTASIALGYAENAVASHSTEIRTKALNAQTGRSIRPAIEARLRVWYNSELESKNYVVPGLIAVILMIISALLSSLTIAREWEMGTMEQLLSTPVRPADLVFGKMLAYFCVGLADAIIVVVAGLLVFQVPFRGNLLLLGAATCLFLFGAMFWGILLSAIAKTQLLAYQLGLITSFLPAFLMSGFIYSIENMPLPIQTISRIVLARYFIEILKGIFLKGIGFTILWPEFLLLVLYAGIVFLAATRRLSRKMA
jgi:ABC-2 type transport system permease protein